jgi:hypothetical protein
MISTYQRILDPNNNIRGDISLEHTGDSLIKNITQTRMIPTMYMMMYLQITCVYECFIAHIINIWTLPSM